MDFSKKDVAGVMFQYPDTTGTILDPSDLISRAKEHGVGLVSFFFLFIIKEKYALYLIDCCCLWFRPLGTLPCETSW